MCGVFKAPRVPAPAPRPGPRARPRRLPAAQVYISPISALQIDEANALKTTDSRLLRRMSRDYLFRGHSASRTLSMWSNVRRGEHRWIFPHQASRAPTVPPTRRPSVCA